ncbi:MAG: LLM class flavin-dependent oxidoreductase [Nitrospinota bacterium]
MKDGLSFGIGIFPHEERRSTLEVVEAVKAAEEAGFSHGWKADTQGIFRDPYVTLTLCAVETSTIKLGTAVTNPITRHPAVTARALGTLDEICDGRAILGIGAGDTAFLHLGLKPASTKVLEDAITCMRCLLDGKDGAYGGRRVPALSHFEPRKVPIYLAANGPKMLALGARLCDGVIASVGATYKVLRYVVETVHQAAEGAGRDPKSVDIVVQIGCDVSEDREQARRNVRTYVARRPIAAVPLEKTGFTAEEARRFKKAYNYQEHMRIDAKHADLVPEEWIDHFSLAGTPGEVVEKLDPFVRAGVNQVFLLSTTRESKSLIRTFQEKIMPAIV